MTPGMTYIILYDFGWHKGCRLLLICSVLSLSDFILWFAETPVLLQISLISQNAPLSVKNSTTFKSA